MVAPYASSPQLVYLYLRQMVNCIAGSSLCLLYGVEKAPKDDEESEEIEAEPLAQVITKIDLEAGTFTWLEKDDLRAVIDREAKAKIDEDNLVQMFVAMGALYGVSLI